jgi:ribonuclease Z
MRRYIQNLLIICALAAQALAQPDATMLSDGQLHVVLCGTGSPLPDATRASACVAVVAGGDFVLLDAVHFGPENISSLKHQS